MIPLLYLVDHPAFPISLNDNSPTVAVILLYLVFESGFCKSVVGVMSQRLEETTMTMMTKPTLKSGQVIPVLLTFRGTMYDDGDQSTRCHTERLGLWSLLVPGVSR